MNLTQYIQYLESLQDNYADMLYDALKNREAYILAIPKRRLTNFGTDANDKKITPEYSPITKRIKGKKGKRISHVTLRDTGQLYRSFKIEKQGEAIDFFAPVNEKTSFLTTHYSSNELFGFSPRDIIEIDKLFLNGIAQKILKMDELDDYNF